MEIDVTIGEESMAIDVDNPYRMDIAQVAESIREFGGRGGAQMEGLDLEELIARMIKGVAGCEHGCPADAKGLVYHGFGNYELSYIDGGILSARLTLDNDTEFEIKVFPGF